MGLLKFSAPVNSCLPSPTAARGTLCRAELICSSYSSCAAVHVGKYKALKRNSDKACPQASLWVQKIKGGARGDRRKSSPRNNV